ncbi:hypothetical protein [Seonamhaeicola sp.]|uniref:hypothetical protein n=1 Tax=Seonamhaeicola sp. TaxID=1912245 RepID=UPI00356ABB45
MQHSPTNLEIIEVLAYSRLIAKKLNSGECIALHQWANLGIVPAPQVQIKFKQLLNEIKQLKWQRPLVKYDENLYLSYYCSKTATWIKLEEK